MCWVHFQFVLPTIPSKVALMIVGSTFHQWARRAYVPSVAPGAGLAQSLSFTGWTFFCQVDDFSIFQDPSFWCKFQIKRFFSFQIFNLFHDTFPNFDVLARPPEGPSGVPRDDGLRSARFGPRLSAETLIRVVNSACMNREPWLS